MKAVVKSGVNIFDKLETLLVPVDQAEGVLLGHHRDELLVLAPGDVHSLSSSLAVHNSGGHVEEHPQVQSVLCLLLVIISDQCVASS